MVKTEQKNQTMYNLDIAKLDNFYVGEQGWLVHNTNPCRQIALGKDIAGSGMKALSEQTGAPWYRYWEEFGITRRTVDNNFGRAFHQAADRAELIHFSLAGIDDLPGAITAGAKGFTHGNMTNAELHYIANNADILAKTWFYNQKGELLSKGVLPITP